MAPFVLTLEATYIAKKRSNHVLQATEPHQISNNGRGKVVRNCGDRIVFIKDEMRSLSSEKPCDFI